ncbi:hypothetical protein [Caldisericum exile]|uniref:Uncharacterized protein n=1 Tax=Caldisericum exile (strain DSM 21853 / NBRC 104410 / AZM16c01) TaxID=511051 RepID=A0A7U6JF78_CALEA|nr:hypothetical protein [Caldisericum exile]BAL80134.1 hypothetical protein CSE_00080 [Caldisericum exile AZM16c01]
MITLQCELELSKTDKELLLKLMRKFSSCMRFAYNRLIEKLVPVLGAGTMVSQIPPVGYMANLNWRTTNKPTKSVSVIHF